MDFHGFYTGKIFDAYQYLGAHITDAGVVFRTFAPGAQKVSLIGECSQWREFDMNRVYDGNFWERYVDSANREACTNTGFMKKAVAALTTVIRMVLEWS